MNIPQPALWQNAVRAQLRLLRPATRFEIIKLSAAACGLFIVAVFNAGVPVLLGTSGPEGAAWDFTTFGAAEFGLVDAPGLMALVLVYILGCGLGLLRPLFDWSGEPPRRRGFHWSLPIARAHHDLARVTAGLMNLLRMIAILLSASIIGLVLGGNTDSLAVLGATAWVSIFLCPMVVYLVVSAVCILSNRPGMVLWLVFSSFTLPYAVFTLIEFAPGEHFFGAVMNGPVSHTVLLSHGFFPTLISEIPAGTHNWWSAAAFWLVTAGIAIVTAAFRHRES